MTAAHQPPISGGPGDAPNQYSISEALYEHSTPTPNWLRWSVPAAAAVVVFAAGFVVTRVVTESTAAADSGQNVVLVSRSYCGQGWNHPRAGTQVVYVRNNGSRAAEVQIVDPSTGAIFAEVEGLAPQTTRPLRVDLGGGRYALRCLLENTRVMTGPAVTIAGPAGPRGVRPVTSNDLAGPIDVYKAAVTAGIDRLGTYVTALDQAVTSGDRTAARRRWLTAHLEYERLGAAYDAFGDTGEAINGLPDGLAGGASDPEFTGFHRIEAGLWGTEAMPALAAYTRKLAGDVTTLRSEFTESQLEPRDFVLRAHEILEDTLHKELTGRTDRGSGSMLATARANVDGTRTVLAALRPVMASRYPGLGAAETKLTAFANLLDASRTPAGAWRPVTALSATERQRINAGIGDVLERLAPIATIADARRAD